MEKKEIIVYMLITFLMFSHFLIWFKIGQLDRADDDFLELYIKELEVDKKQTETLLAHNTGFLNIYNRLDEIETKENLK